MSRRRCLIRSLFVQFQSVSILRVVGTRLCIKRGQGVYMQKRLVFSKALRGLQLLPRGYSTGTVASGFTEDELQRLKSRARKAGSQFHRPQVALGEDVKPSDKRPVALLVGWAASNLKVLSRYSTLYTKLGIPCLCVAPRVLQIWSTKLGNTLTQNVLNALGSSLSNPCSLILHLCSGASTVTLPVLTEQHSDSSSVLRTKAPPVCVVFDSGPADFSYETGSAAAKLMYRQGGYNFLTYGIAMAIGGITNKLVGSKKRSKLFLSTWLKPP